MKQSAGAMASTGDVPPPPVPWWKHPPPPPLHIQWPPPVINDDDSSPPLPFLQSPPPPHTSRLLQPSPLPPPDEDNTAHNGRRLFSSDERNQLLVHTESSPGKCSGTGLSPGATPRPYGHGGYVPVGAPHSHSPVPASSPSSGAPTIVPPPPGDNDTQAHTTMYNQCTYTIITSTGNIEGGGTQADVNVEFFDKHGSSVLFVNLRSQSRNNFNQGATDTFTVVGDCVPSICKMRLSHDDSGPSPGWFVNTVTVSVLYQTHVFNVFEWLAKDEPPYLLSRVVSSCPA